MIKKNEYGTVHEFVTKSVSILAFTVIIILGIMSGSVFAQKKSPVSMNAGVRWDLLQIMHSTNAPAARPTDSTWLNQFWMQSVQCKLDIKGMANPQLMVHFRFMGGVYFVAPDNPIIETPVQKRVGSSGIELLYIRYRHMPSDTNSLSLQLGIFPYEYTNPWQRLGGYLFRTGVYPGYILSAYDEVNLMGFSVSSMLPSPLRHTLFVTLEQDTPLADVSLTYQAAVSTKAVNVCAAAMFHRILRTDQGHTFYNQTRKRVVIESTKGSDPQYYRTAGIKLIGRLSIDLKTIVSNPRFGKNDLLLYGEAALLGAFNYGGYYNHVRERVPVMGGITIPTCGLLDVAGVEMEWYGSRWKNFASSSGVPWESYELKPGGAYFQTITDPANQDAGVKARTDNFKWNVFAEKKIKGLISVNLCVGSDHVRVPFRGDSPELLLAPNEWYWSLTLKNDF